MNKICKYFKNKRKKKRVMPQKPSTEKKEPFKHPHREIIQRKKSNLQIRTGKNLKIIPIDYKGNFKNIGV